MSNSFVIKGGSVAAKPFTASLAEIAIPRVKRGHHDSLQRAVDEAKAQGFAQGQAEGFEAGRTAGYQAGFEQAYVEASNQQAEAVRAFVAELQRVHDQLEESIAEWYVASEAEMEKLGVKVAEHLISAQLQLDRTIVIETTKNALRQITDANRARIRVNPFDSVILTSAREEILAASASLHGVEIVGDESISGGCIVETERGVVDATLDTRLEIIQGGMEEAA